MKNKSKYLFIALSAITAGLLIAVGVMAFTGPGSNQPPTGSGSLVASQWTTNSTNIYYNAAGNVGIGTTTPTTAKLVVNGTIAASSPVNAGDVATKAYVDAATPTMYIVTTRWQQNGCGAPAAYCPTGWTVVSSWGGGCLYYDWNGITLGGSTQTLCSK